MGVDLCLYATGVTKPERDKAEQHMRKVLPPRRFKNLIYEDEEQFPGTGSPQFEGHFLTFASEEPWSHEEGDLDTLEVRTFLRWPMRGWWPDVYSLIVLFRASLPPTATVYFGPDSSCEYDDNPRWLCTQERLDKFWEVWLSEPDTYYLFDYE